MRVCVNYPVGVERLVMRTAHDWDRDVLPAARDGLRAWFELPLVGHTLECKPCLREGATVHWSKGRNYVLNGHAPGRDLWPYFFGDEHGRVSDVVKVDFEGEARAVRVYHPPGYDENTLRRFPVLYMHDGQNLFFPEEAFAGNEWQVDETMDRLAFLCWPA